jgi:hypothetical protein
MIRCMAVMVKTTAWRTGSDELREKTARTPSTACTENDSLYGGDAKMNCVANKVPMTRGENGNDTLYGETENDSLYGGDGEDELRGEQGADELRGENGNDTLYGGTENDSLYGGMAKMNCVANKVPMTPRRKRQRHPLRRHRK